MNLKKALLALTATGAAVALAFGGTTVATSYSATSGTHTINGSAATAAVTVQGDFSASNLIQGSCNASTFTDWTSAGQIGVDNSGTGNSTGTITFNPLGRSNSTMNLDALKYLLWVGGTQVASGTAADLAGTSVLPGVNAGATPDTNPDWAAGESHLVELYVCLDSSANHGWNGATVSDNFTVTMTPARP